MVLLVVGGRRESWVCRLWAEAAAAGGWLEDRRLGRSREERDGAERKVCV